MWGEEGNRLAVLLMEFTAAGTRIRDVMLTSLLHMGLSVVGDLDRIVLPRPRGWSVRLDDGGDLTVCWPHRSPLVNRARVQLPSVWRTAASRNDAVVLVACCDVNLFGFNGAGPPVVRGILADLAAHGDLVGAAIGYREHGSLAAA
nr:hypothetical protein [Kibdelosporangium sp. MJ126-NF4]CTQ97245.1 hypothetical protein [Kibdelosporangium sp. MJ126-NF4]